MPAITKPTQPEGPQAAAPRVMVYCHDSVGIGHLRRSLAICERVGKQHPQASFMVVTGTPYVQLLVQQDRVDYIKLPALTKTSDGTYRSKFLTLPIDEIMHCRESILLEATRSFSPDVFLVDKAPLGVCRELLPTLRWLRVNRPETRVIFGMRDIEDDAAATIEQWTRDGVQPVIEDCYDEVWVYGMQRVYDVASEYQLSKAIQQKLQYTGYVTRRRCEHSRTVDAESPEVLVTVGGGTDGEAILQAYLDQAAMRVSKMGLRSLIVGGPDLPRDVAERLAAQASRISGVRWTDFEPCMSCRIRAARLVVSMGGYNTLCELATHKKHALVIPRITPRLEQNIRAHLWQELGAVHVLPRDELTAAGLAERVGDMLEHEQPLGDPRIDLGGLERIAARFDAFWSEERDRAIALHMQ